MPGPISQSYDGPDDGDDFEDGLEEDDDFDSDDEPLIPTEPEEDDWVTIDYVHWHHHGFESHKNQRHHLEVFEDQDWKVVLKARMDAEKYWPSVWYCNERGVWDLLDIDIDTGEFVTK